MDPVKVCKTGTPSIKYDWGRNAPSLEMPNSKHLFKHSKHLFVSNIYFFQLYYIFLKNVLLLWASYYDHLL